MEPPPLNGGIYKVSVLKSGMYIYYVYMYTYSAPQWQYIQGLGLEVRYVQFTMCIHMQPLYGGLCLEVRYVYVYIQCLCIHIRPLNGGLC